MATIDDIYAIITADSSGYTAAMNAAQKSTSDGTTSMGEAFKNCGELLDVLITAPLTALAYKAVESFNASTQAAALMNAEIKATGDVSGFSSSQLENYADVLGTVSGFGKTDIMSGVINSLLKFQNISGITFQDASKDATGWAATGTASLQEASQKIGMALENPTRAFALLRNSMAALSRDQEGQILNWMNQGDILDAQNLIMTKLNSAYGQMATTMGASSTPAKQMAADWTTINENLASFGGIVEKAMLPFMTILTNISTAFTKLSSSMQEGIVITLAFVAAFAPILTALGFFITTVVPAMTAGFGLLVSGVAAFNGALVFSLEVILPWIAAIAAAVVIGQILYDNWKSIKDEGAAIWAGIKGYVLEAVAGILGAMEKIPGMGTMFTSTIESMRAEASVDLKTMQVDMANSMNSTVSFGQSFTNLKNEVATGINSVKSSVTGMANHIKTTMEPLWHPPMILGPPPTMVPAWITALGQTQTLAQTTFEAIETAATSLAQDLTAAFTTGGMDWNDAVGKALQAMLASIVDWAIKSLMATQAVAQAIAAVFANPLIAIALIAGLMVAIQSMHLAPPAMAMGGIVSSPTTALIGEAGPEAVLPVVRLANGQMGVQTGTGGSGIGSGNPSSGGGGGSNGPMYIGNVIQINGKTLFSVITKASRYGQLTIHPNAVKDVPVVS